MKFSAEAKVGVFVFIGIVLLVYMSLWLGGLRMGTGEGMKVSVMFPTAAGLDPNAAVTVAGVEVGYVSEILLEGNRAKLVLTISPGVNIGQDFTATMKTKGLLGEKFIELIPGKPDAPLLADGGIITKTGDYSDMDRLVNTLTHVAEDMKGITSALNRVIGTEEGGESLKNIVSNVEGISENLDRIISDNNEKFNDIMTNLDYLMTTLREDSPGVLKGLNDVTRSLNEVIVENRGSLKDSMENLRLAAIKLGNAMDAISKLSETLGPKVDTAMTSIGNVARKIDEGEGTLGKLVNETETHDQLTRTLEGINNFIEKTESFKTYVGYRGEVLLEEQDVKSYFSLKIQPKSDKYYLFEIIDAPRGRRESKISITTIDGVRSVTRVDTTSDDILFSAQIAKRFDDLVLRGGVIESEGGVGVEYYLLEDRLKLYVEAFDFNRKRNPHLRAGGMLSINEFFYLSAGYDNFISREGLSSPYVGVGFRFEDDDLKYLLGSIPSMSF